MKKTSYILLTVFVLLFATLMLSCEDKIKHTLIVTGNVSLFEGDQAEIEVTSGNGGYKVESMDQNIVQASVNGSTITVMGKREGVTSLLLKDGTGQQANIEVQVGIVPLISTKDFTDDLLHTALSQFGLNFEKELDGLTGRITFTIQSKEAEKLRKTGYSPKNPVDKNTLKAVLTDGDNDNQFSVVWNPDDTKAEFSFGSIFNGSYYLVHVEISRFVDNGDIEKLKLKQTYIKG